MRKKFVLLNRQESKLLTLIAQMYKNALRICWDEKLNLRNDMSFFSSTTSVFGNDVSLVFRGNYVREAFIQIWI